MSAQSDESDDRAFVVQFERTEGEWQALRGRVEAVTSGDAIRFRSLAQLIDFMTSRLRRQR
jgi:hypothetical protein